MQKARYLTEEETKWLLSLKKEDITLDLLRKTFADGKTWKKKFETYDRFYLPAGKLYNKTTIETTPGRYIFNLVVIPESYLKKHGYLNVVFTKGFVSDMEAEMGTMLLLDEMTHQEFVEYLDRGHWILYGLSSALNPSTSYSLFKPIPEVIQKREELFEKYKEDIERGDPVVSQKIEDELKKIMTKHFEEKGDESFGIIRALGGKRYTNAQKISIMSGAVKDLGSGKYNIIKSNYLDGVDKEDLPKIWDLTIFGGYSRGVETMDTGYEVKKLQNAMQAIVLDEMGTDCGTDQYIEVLITKDNYDMFDLRYIVDKSGNTKLVTSEDLKKLIGKKLRFRSPMVCKSEKICSKCAGELHLRMGIKNVGLIASAVGGSLSNVMMKAFHDPSVKTGVFDPEDYIEPIGK